MRTLLRVGGITGIVVAALAFMLAPRLGLAVAPLTLAAGLAAGLGTAKWLPRAWYGRQFAAGMCAGALAAGIAAAGTFAALAVRAPRDMTARAPLSGASASMGWVAAGALAVTLGALLACMLAAITARLCAPTKSARFVRAVQRAREASRPLREQTVLAQALGRATPLPLVAVAMASARATRSGIAAVPAPAPALMAASATQQHPAAAAPGRAPNMPNQRAGGPALVTGRRGKPQPVPQPEPTAAKAPPKRRTSARPAPSRLTPEMIEALAAWARDDDEAERDDDDQEAREDLRVAETVAAGSARAGQAEKRAAVESTYLNSAKPASKRKRKKNATREWIC
ncbi:MAG: hypothetical protein ACHQ4H_06205 [Ktedonobacterales bacterium]|jgi:hypothetical protein